MNNTLHQFRPASNWISAALITVFVVSFAVLSEDHVRPEASAANDTIVTDFWSGSKHDSNRFFIRYH